jgi:hypothetical protein
LRQAVKETSWNSSSVLQRPTVLFRGFVFVPYLGILSDFYVLITIIIFSGSGYLQEVELTRDQVGS